MLTVPIPLLAPDSSVLEENLIRSARRRTRRSCGLYFDNNNNYNDNKSRSSDIQNNNKCSSNMAERMIESLVGDITAEIDIICRDDPSYDHHASMLARKRLDLGMAWMIGLTVNRPSFVLLIGNLGVGGLVGVIYHLHLVIKQLTRTKIAHHHHKWECIVS